MAIGTPTPEGGDHAQVEVDIVGDPTRLVNELRAALRDAFRTAERELDRGLLRRLGEVGKVGTSSIKNFGSSVKNATKNIERQLAAIKQQAEGATASIGKGLDPRTFALLNNQLEEIARLQDVIRDNAGEFNDQDLSTIRAALSATRLEVNAGIATFEESSRAARQADKDKAESARQAARSRIVEMQTAAKAESDAIHTSTNLQIAEIQAAARRRTEIMRAAVRTIETLERGLRHVFRGTAQVVGSAFNAIAKVGSSAFGALRRSVTNNNTSIRNSYQSTFTDASRTVNKSTQVQSEAMNRFASSATSSLGEVGTAVSSLGNKMDGLNYKAVALAGILGAGVAKALTGGFKRATVLENAERALTKLTGSAESAVELLGEVDRVVTGTPFKLDQFSAAATQLLAFNVEAQKIPDILETIANASSLSIDPNLTVDRLVRTFGQIQTAGKVTTEDLNQLTEAGVPAWALLGNAIGKTIPQMREMVEKGALPATEAIDSLIKGINEGTDGVNGATVAFGGLAQELGGTLQGSVANLRTAFDRAGANVIKVFTPALVAGASAARRAVDLIGSAVQSLAQAVVDSPVFKFIVARVNNLTEVLTKAKTVLKPAFDFIAEGIVTLGTALGSLAALRRIPGLFTLIGVAAKRIFTPFNLLVTAGVVVAGLFKRLVEGSPDLQDALGKLGKAFERIGTVVGHLAREAFRVLAAAIEKFLVPAANSLADLLVSVLVPAIESFADFLNRKVFPALRRFARFIRDTVFPVIADFADQARTKIRQGFELLVDFITEKVIPTVGPYLEKAVGIAKTAWEGLYNFLSRTVVPFLKGNLVPVLTGVGVALGALALTGGNLPLAGIAGIAAGLGAALSNADIRTALVEKVRSAITEIQELLKNLFSTDVLTALAKGALKAANTIGRVLGDIISDRRLLAVVGGIAAFAVALGASFVAGLVEGIINNIPELITGMGDALKAAFKEIVGDGKLLTAFLSIFASSALLASVVRDGRRVGRAFALSVSEGASSTALGGSSGTGARAFTRALFGGREAIAADMSATFSEVRSLTRNEVGRLNEVLGDIRGPFVGSDDARETAANLDRTVAAFGRARVGAQFLRTGIRNIGEAITSFNRTSVPTFQKGMRNIGQGLKLAGREVAITAGIVAGGAFAASFVSQALFDINSSGADKLRAGLGLAASAAGVFQALGGGAAGTVGAGAVIGIGVVTSAMQRGKQRAEEFKKAVDELATSLTELKGEEAADALDEFVKQKFFDQSDDVLAMLNDIGVKYDDFADAARENRGVQFIAEQFRDFGPAGEQFAALIEDGTISLGRIDDAIAGRERFDGLDIIAFRDELNAAGVDTGDFEHTFSFLGETLKVVNASFDLSRERLRALGQEFSDLPTNGRPAQMQLQAYREELQLTAAAADITAAATDAFNQTVDRLNDQRLEPFKESVDEATTKVGEAKSVAEDALQAMQDFFRGGSENSLANATDDAIIGVSNLADTITNDLGNAANLGASELQAKLNQSIQGVKDEASTVLREGIEEGTIVDKASAEAALQPLITAAYEKGGEGGEEAVKAIQEIISTFSLPEDTNLLEGAFDAQAELAKQQEILDGQEALLTVQMGIDPLAFDNIKSDAETAFNEAADSAIAGYNEKMGDSNADQSGTTAFFEKSLQAALDALDANSPSKEYEKIAGFAIAGFNQGLVNGGANVVLASRGIGIASAQGVARGIDQGTGFVNAAIRRMADSMIRTLRSEMEIESPSKVTAEIGGQVIEGLIVGMEDDVPKLVTQSSVVADRIIGQLTKVGQEAARAIGTGFATEGASFVNSIGSALDTALDVALSKVDQFKAAGNAIGLALFQNQGANAAGIFGGGTAKTNLQKAFLSISTIGDRFNEAFNSLTDKIGFYAFTFDPKFSAGKQNQQTFYDLGLEIRDYAATLIEAGRPLSNVIGETKGWRDVLINAGLAAGATSAQITEMINNLGLSDAQLSKWAKSAVDMAHASAAARKAEEDRIALEKEFARIAEEKAKKKEAETSGTSTQNLPPPIFRDLVVQTVGGDPEAIALATANRIAFSVRR